MIDAFEENLGRNLFITLPQVKDYLVMTSNTHDARLSNIISYATSVVEHYIGQEVLANNYTEVFDGGKSSLFVNRLPLNNVYQVTEFTGSDYIILADPSTTGQPIKDTGESLTFTFINNAELTNKIKKFGESSLKLNTADYIVSPVNTALALEEDNFTIEAFVRIDTTTIQNNVIFEINTDSSNYMRFSLANQYGLSFESNVLGASTIVTGANTLIESQQFQKRRWMHIAVSRDLDNERLYLYMDGTTIANVPYTIENHTFTSNVEIGKTFKGYIDELRVSTNARYTNNFSSPTVRFRPDNDTVLLMHFDEGLGSTNTKDSHSALNEYSYSKDTGEIIKSTSKYLNSGLSSLPRFYPYQNGVTVDYRAGYEIGQVPYDLQLATLDFIKILYKQDQEKKGMSFEGERGEKFTLSSNFPPHITRVLDLYRIIR